MKLTVHQKGWVGSRMRREGEQGGVLLNAVIEIDGHLILEVTEVEVLAKGDSFTLVNVQLLPGEIEFVSHTEESWKFVDVPQWIKDIADEQ